MAKRMTKEEKRIENEFDRCYRLYGSNGFQINVLDMGKFQTEVIAAHKAGQNMEEAFKAIMPKYDQRQLPA